MIARTVGRRLDRRVAFYQIAICRIVGVVEVQEVHAGLGRDALAVERAGLEQRQLVRGRDVQHVQARAVAARQVDRQRVDLMQALARADERMALDRDRVAVSRALCCAVRLDQSA